MKFQVTQENINNGVRGKGARCYECPVALALNAATGDIWKVHSTLLVNTSKKTQYILEPGDPIGHFINYVDNGCAMRPVEFEIDDTKFVRRTLG